ncbi:MAG: ankyrin repeat domain-containing protein [Gammaproteobacteria bacterium]|nr:ankyrin repeat domain-containing protein [Gammaproteobacteria bacterium]
MPSDNPSLRGINKELFLALEAGDGAKISRLLDAGADVNARGYQEAGPLYWAAIGSPPAIVQLLIDRGAKVDDKDMYGNTPLATAALAARPEIIEMLIRAGADVNSRNKTGATPLLWSVDVLSDPDYAKVVPPKIADYVLRGTTVLLASGADVQAKGEGGGGLTALHFAAQSGVRELVDLLLAKGAQVDARTRKGVTPLYEAAKCGRSTVVDGLLNAGADVNARTQARYTALMVAATSGQAETVAVLLAHGADVNAVDEIGQTPLLWALRAALRLPQAATPHPSDKQMQYELQCLGGHWNEVAVALIDKGADVDVRDKDGKSAVELAQRLPDKAVAERISSRKAPTRNQQ